MVLTGEAGFVAVEGEEGVAWLGFFFESQRGADIFGDEFKLLVDGGALPMHFEIELGAFNGPEAALTPFRAHHFVDEVELNHIARLKVLEVGGAELIELLAVFVGEDDGGRGEAVRNRVLRGAAFAGLGFWAFGFGAVGAA